MAESDPNYPVALRPGGFHSSPPRSHNPYSNPQQPQQSNSGWPLENANQPGAVRQPPTQQPLREASPISDRYSFEMAPQEYGDNIGQGQGHIPGAANTGFSNAPKPRTSSYGARDAEAIQQQPPPPLPTQHQQQPLFAQHSGPLGGRPSSSAGPSNTRVTSYGQAPPVPSIVHTSGPSQTAPGPASRPTSSKSPFTTPITCPPRNHPHQILIVNPTSTSALTGLMLNTLRPILPTALEVTAYTAPYPAPTAIESSVDAILSSETTLRDLAKHSTNNSETIQNFDALLVASYGKHPVIDALRESYDVPVIGTMEASLYVARMLGARFGIISTSTRTKLQIDDAVAAYGLTHFYVGVESIHVSPHDLLHLPSLSRASSPVDSSSSTAPTTAGSSTRLRDEIHKRLALQSKALVAKGADTIILGNEFLSSAEVLRAVKDAVRDEDGRRTVNVVDPIEAGVMMLNALAGLGVPSSKKGLYRGERDGRRGRGQKWL